MSGHDSSSLLNQYAKGSITRKELIYHLIQAATTRPPEVMALVLPPDMVDEIRAAAKEPPATLELAPRIAIMGSWIGQNEYLAEQQRQQQRWFDGIWRWHRYFEST